jgi:hypothetical protein
MGITIQTCPECAAAWQDGKTCQDDFYQMGYWELENPALQVVHHLMVLCYHLQHPSLYSPDGVKEGKRLLVDFLERGLTTEQVRERNRDRLDSGKRTFKIKGTPGSQGSYDHPVTWMMRAADVTAGGAAAYIGNVEAWARAVLVGLRESGNLA